MSIELKNELLFMAKQDQDMRHSEEWDASIDEQNTVRLKTIVDERGWPTISAVGDEASQAAWLLVQHADHNPAFQTRCLDLMKALPEDEIRQADVAYLEDRVRVNTFKPQLYGTQFFRNQTGDLVPRPIEDIEHIGERRRKAGLGSFADYERLMNEKYGSR